MNNRFENAFKDPQMKPILDLLKEKGAPQIKIFGGGGGTYSGNLISQ